MTDELIANTGMALCENALAGKVCPCRHMGSFACADEFPGQQARAAIRVIAPAVLEQAAQEARDCAIHKGDFLINSDIRATCAGAIRALKEGYGDDQ